MSSFDFCSAACRIRMSNRSSSHFSLFSSFEVRLGRVTEGLDDIVVGAGHDAKAVEERADCLGQTKGAQAILVSLKFHCDSLKKCYQAI